MLAGTQASGEGWTCPRVFPGLCPGGLAGLLSSCMYIYVFVFVYHLFYLANFVNNNFISLPNSEQCSNLPLEAGGGINLKL